MSGFLGKCGCGSGCSCGHGCGGCGMYPDVEKSTTVLLDGDDVIFMKTNNDEGAGESFGAEGGHGCKCGPNCKCNPCNCS